MEKQDTKLYFQYSLNYGCEEGRGKEAKQEGRKDGKLRGKVKSLFLGDKFINSFSLCFLNFLWELHIILIAWKKSLKYVYMFCL